MAILGRWDDVPAAAERCRQFWLEAQRPAAGYAVSAFISALDVARGRREDGAERWSAVLDEILGGFEEGHPMRRLRAFVAPDLDSLANDVIANWQFYVARVQHLERALAACADRRQQVPTAPLDEIIERARRLGQRPLLAQAIRVRGLHGPLGEADLNASLSMFREMTARPYASRVEVELGKLIGDDTLLARGLEALEELGDVDQLERVRSHIGRPAP
jgi:hypothetical protein